MEKDIIQQFISFVGSRPRDEQYRYLDFEGCPLAEFGKFLNPGKRIIANGQSFYNRTDNTETLVLAKWKHRCSLINARNYGELFDRLSGVPFWVRWFRKMFD